MNYEKQIKEILENSKANIQEQIKENLEKQIVDSLSWNLKNEISEIVKEYFNTEMKDDIKAILDEYKATMLESIKPAFATAGAEIAKSLEVRIVKNLNSSYDSEKIITSLFK